MCSECEAGKIFKLKAIFKHFSYSRLCGEERFEFQVDFLLPSENIDAFNELILHINLS